MSDESDDSDEEKYDELGSESRSAGTSGTRLGGFLRGLGFPLGVTISADESCNGNRVSLALTYKNIGEAFTGECTGNASIFSIAQILVESWIDPMFYKSAGMG